MKLPTKLRGLFLIAAVLTLLGAGTAAQTPYQIAIDVYHDAMQGTTVSVPVVKAAGSEAIWGFDFLIKFDTVTLSFAGLTPGEVFDIPGAYEWEYFEFRVDTVGDYAGFLRAVALANTNDGPHVPLDVTVPDGTTLFTLNFDVTADTSYNCTWNPVRFYWMDCGDNVIAPDSLGMVLAVSDGVYDWIGGGHMDVSEPYGPLPGLYGVPDSCVTDTMVIRMIDFYNGGIDVHCTDEIDDRGDINCNGIANELADYVTYFDYFIFDTDAFNEHIECSVSASDVNADGSGLRVEDLIYLHRITRGDALPYPDLTPHDSVAVTFVQDDDTKTIALDYTDTLAGIHLVFEGEITPTIMVDEPGVMWYYAYYGGLTRVVIAPEFDFTCPGFVADGAILTYTGSALLIEADAADCDDHVFSVTIENNGSGLTIPYAFEIEMIPDAILGQNISIPITKTAGSNPLDGFDLLIGYDISALNITGVTPGIVFDIPGDYEWDFVISQFGPFDCSDPICPSGLVRILGLAETLGDGHSPLDTDIPNGTVLFTLEAVVTTDLTMEDLFIPIRFFWIDCGDNEVAYEVSTSPYTAAGFSDHVYNYDGFEITDPAAEIPGYTGAPDACFEGNSQMRFIDFTNGGVYIGPLEDMKLIVRIDSVSADVGDSAIYVDIRLSNPQDTVVAFTLYIQTDRPDLVEFGMSPDDTMAVDVTGTLIEDWEFIEQRSLSGTYHDLKITAISNSMPPYDKGISPRIDGVLCRLILHAYDDIPPVVTDSTVQLIINQMPSQTSFSDPNGITLGVDGGAYDFEVVSFRDGYVTVQGMEIGDANGDGFTNVADIVFLVSYVFKGGPAPDPIGLGDVNCDGGVNVADAVYMVNYVFKGGPAPGEGC